MAVPAVFLSSVIRDFEDVRDEAAEGIRAAGMFAIRSEDTPASSASPRRALLDQVEAADIYLLLLGRRYGEIEPSPTEEEFQRAQDLARPTLVLVQEGELEPSAVAFLERIRGGWGEGLLSGKFKDAGDVRAVVAATLVRHQSGVSEDIPSAQARASELARGEESRSSFSGGVAARAAFVPLRSLTLLDAPALDMPGLGDRMAAIWRDSGLVPQSVGISVDISATGILMTGSESDNWTRPEAAIYAEGSVTATGSVARGTGHLDTSNVGPAQLEQFLGRAAAFAQAVWDELDRGHLIDRLAAAAAIPEAEHKGYGGSQSGSMSISMRLPQTVVAPDPPEIWARAQLHDERLASRLTAAIKRVFADAGALQE